jgi:hypothetical protein
MPASASRAVRHRLTAAVVAASAAFAALPAASPIAPSPAVAKSCSGGYTHAVVNGSHKCLRRGQFCARSADSVYHHYGFHCHKRDARGSYHLS